MDYTKLRHYRHADPLKVRQVWDTLDTVKSQRIVVSAEKLVKSLRKSFGLKDDQIRLLLDEIEGDGLIEKVCPSFGKGGVVGYRLPDFSTPCPRGKHDWYCYQCHKPGEVLRCSDCFRVYHSDCAQEASKLSSPSGKSLRSPTLHDGLADEFSCAVCESRPKCGYSRKQIRKLLDFATHQLRKQPIWKTFQHIGYPNEINKNEYLVFKYTDLELLYRKIKDGRYVALEEFSMDIQLLVHNICILHGPYSSQADEVRFLLRSINTEVQEIQLCTDCYINAKTRLTDWISKPCKPPHELIWARNRTPAGAGLYNDACIAQFYWPAKVLLERDDAFEIRFFGGTHERALAKKTDTRPFHIPVDHMSGEVLSGGGFERAWTEVSKLQANIESGYYTHSSGESDLPPSDEDYSDEFYLGPRRGIVNHIARSSRTGSSRSSSIVKRKRHASSSSHNTTTTATPTNDAPSSPEATSLPRSVRVTRGRGRKSRIPADITHPRFEYTDKRLSALKLNVQPGTPGAAAISALAETKAAMAAAVGRTTTTDLFDLTNKHHTLLSSGIASNANAVRGKRGRGRGRPPKTLNRVTPQKKHPASLSGSTSERSLSSLSSRSNSDVEDVTPTHTTTESDGSETDWLPKNNKASRGKSHSRRRGGQSGDRRRTLVKSMDPKHDSWLKNDRTKRQLASPGRGRPRLKPSTTSSARKRYSSPTKKLSARLSGKSNRRHSLDGLNDEHDDDDDELTDRCCSPPVSSPEKAHINIKRRSTHNPSPFSPDTKKISPIAARPSPTKRTNGTSIKRPASSSTGGSSYSSSASEGESDTGRNSSHRLTSVKTSEGDRRLRSPRNKELRLSGTSGTMLRRPPFAPPLGTSSSVANSTLGFERADHMGSSSSSNPYSTLSGLSSSTNMDSSVVPSATSAVFASIANSSLQSTMTPTAVATGGAPNCAAPGVSQLPRSHLPPNKRAAAAATAAALSGSCEHPDANLANQQSPRSIDAASQLPTRKLVSKGSQTTAYSCPHCKDLEAQRVAEAAEHKRALEELEDRLLAQMKEEKALATQAALEQAQTTMRETIEREQKLALEAAEARFAEVLIQTKRRQWCRNCLSEAIYHCCWNTSYCSIPCQQEHWQNEHKRQCRRKR